MGNKTNKTEDKSEKKIDWVAIGTMFIVALTLISSVGTGIFGSGQLSDMSAKIQSNTSDIGHERTLMAIYKTEQAEKWNALSTAMSLTREPINVTPTKPISTETSIPLVTCPWAISSPEITKEFQFTCPDNLLMTSVNDTLLKRNGFTYMDLSNISEITFNTMVTKIPVRSDFLTEENYEDFFQFVEYSVIAGNAEITDYYKFRFYPVLRQYDNNRYWKCCGFDSEDKLSKQTSINKPLSSFNVKSQLNWDIKKTDKGINVKVKMPDTPNWLDFGIVVPGKYFTKPTLMIGYSNPQSCQPTNCSLQVKISEIVIK
mgnify:CR=1 FL=1